MQEIEFYFYIIQLSYNSYLYPNRVVRQFHQSLGITLLTRRYVKVFRRGVGYILSGFGRGRMGTQVVTKTSLLSVHVAVFGLVPLCCSAPSWGVYLSEVGSGSSLQGCSTQGCSPTQGS